MTGSGGWPLSLFLTPDKKPVYAGTYFPKYSRYQMPGFIDILNNINNAWKTKRESIIKSSDEIIDFIKEHSETKVEETLDMKDVNIAFNQFKDDFDRLYGGFGNAPKFPSPHNLLLLMRYYKYTKNEEALKMCIKTLEGMYKGGIYDHIGYGFSRYSTDKKWLLPHFEKMLYDNALLLRVYTEAYVITNKTLYKEIAEEIIEYVLRDMTDETGGFYCAEDADSEGVEGKFYVWDYNEIVEILTGEEVKLFTKYYNITPSGNFDGSNIPNLIETKIEEIEKDKAVKVKLKEIKQKLFNYRENRIHPHKDDKILLAWNGIMIASLSYAGRIFQNNVYIKAAEKAANFILDNMINKEGRLLVSYRKGVGINVGFLNEYSFFVWGLTELYETTFIEKYLENAVKYNQDMIDLFWDENQGGLFLYGKENEQLVLKPKEIYDGAIPSGNSVAALNLLRISKLTDSVELKDKFDKLVTSFSAKVKNSPRYFSFFMISILYGNADTKDIVIAGNKESIEVKDFIEKLNTKFNSFFTIIVNDKSESLLRINENLENKSQIDGKTTVYICKNYNCKTPINDLNLALEEIVN